MIGREMLIGDGESVGRLGKEGGLGGIGTVGGSDVVERC